MGRLLAGIGSGAVDEMVEQFTDAEVSVASGMRDQMKHCEPWSQHFTNEGIKKLNDALKNNDAKKAKRAIEQHMTETTATWCIDTLKTVVVLVCTKCPTI